MKVLEDILRYCRIYEGIGGYMKVLRGTGRYWYQFPI